MIYKYEHIDEKSLQGVMSEMEKGLIKIGTYFYTTYGMPADMFTDLINDKLPTNEEKLLYYMTFRSKNPNVFAK